MKEKNEMKKNNEKKVNINKFEKSNVSLIKGVWILLEFAKNS